MVKRKLSRSIRKFIRKEKARIRRDILDSNRQKELIAELRKKHDNQRDLQLSDK